MAINKKRTPNRIKMLVSLVFAFLFVTFLTPRIFINDTTALNPSFLASIKRIPYSALAYIQNPFSKEERTNTIESSQIQQVEPSSDIQYTPLSKGVYAAEDPKSGSTVVKIEAGTEVEVYSITTNDGRELKVYVPLK